MNTPPSPGFKFSLTTESGDDMTAELKGFAEMIGIEQAAPGRYSLLLLLSLLGGAKSGRLNPHKVVQEILALEGIGPPSQLKPPIQNKHPPLKGLWHKHHLMDGMSSLAMNIEKGLNRYKIPFFEQKIMEAQQAGEERFMSAADIPMLVNDVVSGNYNRLAENEALTGEWLVFAKHEEKNYYLALATHDSATHDALRQQIEAICYLEFSFLPEILNPDRG
ncbi:hypothetical protein [Duganella sp. S19_KUP01_CR8]|uniref:hypothetical protein n=1 Tax=Duganella sp. S19_KUP01_CR8 TaxID=3025502 RepID=UPI002FCD7328